MLNVQDNTGSGNFELVVQIRNSQGEPIGHTKSVVTDSADKLAAFWFKMHGRPKRRNQVKVKSTQPDKILAEINDRVETKDIKE